MSLAGVVPPPAGEGEHGRLGRVPGHGEARSGRQREAAAGWPTLTGTEFHVDQALTLRAGAIAEIRERLTVRSDDPVKREAAALWTEVALRQTDARWWISHRDDLAGALRTALTDADRVRLHEIQAGKELAASHPA